MKQEKNLMTYLPNVLTTKNPSQPSLEKGRGKVGFTLAEVLITLGIIGVVAALTMPSLIQKHQKKVFASKVKQTYSILSNALISSVADNGPTSEWDYGNSSEGVPNDTSDHIEIMLKKYFIPYLEVIEHDKKFIRLANGTTLFVRTDGNTKDGIYTPTVIYIVANFEGYKESFAGSTRNYSRKDVLYKISYSKKDKIEFFNWGPNTREGIINEPTHGCNKNIEPHKRFGCGALIQYDGWEIKDDYPW